MTTVLPIPAEVLNPPSIRPVQDLANLNRQLHQEDA